MEGDADRNIEYMQQVIAWQPRLRAFACLLLGNPNEADDVLQNANVALLQKQAAFRLGSDFGAWAMQIAYHEVQRHWESSARAERRFDKTLLDHWRPGWKGLAASGRGTPVSPPVHGPAVDARRRC